MTNRAVTDAATEQVGSTLWVTLDRPDSYNALTPGMLKVLDDAMDIVDSDSDVKALVITGRGHAFCAGADLKGVVAGQATLEPSMALKRLLERGAVTFSRLEALRVPTIAAVNGLALAGGLELALCCDLIVAAPSAHLGDAHAKYAQLPGGGGTVRLPRRIGAAKAKYLMFTGMTIDASTAFSWGLVDVIAPAEGIVAAVEAILQRMNAKSALVLERMKWLIQQGESQPLDTALRAEIAMCAWHTHSHDRNEGLAAFEEKRSPRYLGY